MNKSTVLPDGTPAQPDKGWGYSPRDRLQGVGQALAQRQERQSSGVLLSALNQLLAQDMKIIEQDGFERVQEKMAAIAKQRRAWFTLGFNGIHVVSNPELFAGFNPNKAEFYVSAVDELLPGFNPAKELNAAITKIDQGKALTFNNEYAVETLWHEMMHGITGVAATHAAIGVAPIEEGIVQLAARHTYHRLLAEFGGSARYQQRIIKDGMACPLVTQNLLWLMAQAGLSGENVVDILSERNGNWLKIVKQKLKLGLDTKRVGGLLNAATSYELSDLKEKLKMLQRNAPLHNKGE